MIHKVLKVTLILSVLLFIFAIVFMWCLSHYPQSNFSLNQVCASNIRSFSVYLKERAALGTLPLTPSTMLELQQAEPIVGNAKISPHMLVCPFDDDVSCSYVFTGMANPKKDSMGKSVIVYCSAIHPDTINKPGEEKQSGYKLVIRPDFSEEKVAANETFTEKQQD